MSRFDKACILVALLTVPLLWRFSPAPRPVQAGAGAKGGDSWQTLARPEKKDLLKVRDRLVVAPALGYVAPEKGQEPTGKKEVAVLFHGTFQIGTVVAALMESGDTIQLCRPGAVLADGSTVLAISTNSVDLRLSSGVEKKVALYEESL